MTEALPGDIFRVGQVLNHTYEIEGVLGRGGTGEVYRARNQITGRVVAIKALNREFSRNADYLELMKREEEMRAISHDAVVRYTDCNRTADGNTYLVMDFVDGVPLSEWLERGGAATRDLLVVAHRVAEGLVATHARGIVHRDLSPDNIVLRGGDPEQAVIIDFGIAKDTRAGARTIVGNGFAGKYEYAAPEQMNGRAEPRSDLYALGSSLLAVFRGRVPELGSSPGEIVRLKERPLDLAGVPSPLKDLIAELTQPDPARRPPSAAAVVTEIERLLRPGETAGGARTRRLWPMALPLIAAVLAGGLWFSGAIEHLFAERLPLAAPFALTAASKAEGVTLEGNAPSPAARTALAAAMSQATGAALPADSLTLALGAPIPDWGEAMAGLIAVASGLEEWRIEALDAEVALAGVATDAAARDAIAARFAERAEAAGLRARSDIAAGPRLLSPEALAPVLQPLRSCGPLRPLPPEDGAWPLETTVAIAGAVGRGEDIPRIAEALRPRIGDRSLRLDLAVLNPALCTVQDVLPDAPGRDLSIALGTGGTDEANMAGIYAAGDNPLIDVLAPTDPDDGYLWVGIADLTGNVFNLLPNINRPEHALAAVGKGQDGIRAIRIAHSLDEQKIDPAKLVLTVDRNFGKSLIFAIVTDAPLFDELRPTTESVESFAEALEDRLASGAVEVRAVATRLIDARG